MRTSPQKNLLAVSVLSISLIGCGSTNNNEEAQQSISALPLTIQSTSINPISDEKVALGKALFWDPIMSGNRDVACATCHHPDHGYADSQALSIGVGGSGLGNRRQGNVLAARNAHTVLNTAFNGIDTNGNYQPESAVMFWDNRALSLEMQSLMPLLSREEMRGENFTEAQIYDEIITRLKAIPEYQQLFSQAFGDSEINIERIAQAIASFERTLVANNSRFDRFMRGDSSAMSNYEQSGMQAFIEAGCANCHSGPMFSDYQLHVLGVPDSRAAATLPIDSGSNGSYAFRTPTLRNLNLTAPYMHNGVFSTLEEVMEFYEEAAEGDNIHPDVSFSQLAPELRQLELGEGGDDDGGDDDAGGDGDEGNGGVNAAIIAFMKTLEDDQFDKSIPLSVPSGLNPGGNI